MELTWTGIAGEEGVGGLRARSWGGAGGGDALGPRTVDEAAFAALAVAGAWVCGV